MELVVVQSPYHLGREDGRLSTGVAELTTVLAGDADVLRVEPDGEDWNEIAASLAVVRGIAARVREVVERGAVPLVLAGNCNSSLGTVAGLGRRVGVVWFDAHGDFNTPDTTETGFIDGMGLALLTGSGWRALRATVPGFRPVPESDVVLVGARDLDAGELERLEGSEVRRARGDELPDALDDLRERADDVYVHIDLDVLDPSVGRANWLPVEGGLLVDELARAVDEIAARFTIRAAALTCYAPDCDPERAIPVAARAVRHRVAAAVGARRAAA